MPSQPAQTKITGILAASWALAGFLLLLSKAIVALSLVTWQALSYPLSPLHWLALLANVVFMAWSEGYKGFQQGFSPRFARRAKFLMHSGNIVERLLAPLYCMHFFNAPRRRMVVSYALLLMILAFIFMFSLIPQPWRGILDAGVVVGLVWGLLSTVYACAKILPQDSSAQLAPGKTTT